MYIINIIIISHPSRNGAKSGRDNNGDALLLQLFVDGDYLGFVDLEAHVARTYEEAGGWDCPGGDDFSPTLMGDPAPRRGDLAKVLSYWALTTPVTGEW